MEIIGADVRCYSRANQFFSHSMAPNGLQRQYNWKKKAVQNEKRRTHWARRPLKQATLSTRIFANVKIIHIVECVYMVQRCYYNHTVDILRESE